MMHMIVAGIAMVFLINGFHFVYCFSGVQRAYLGLYKGIVEEATMVVNTSGGYLATPMIHIARLNTLLEDYFHTELDAYCRSYEYRVSVPGTHLHVLSSRKVVITLDVTLDDLHQFHKTAHFMVEEAKNL